MDEIDILLNSAEDISEKIPETKQNSSLKVIRQIDIPDAGGESIAKLVKNRWDISSDTNIFSVSEILDRIQSDDRIHYYPLKTKEGYFAGIFSSQDMLIYLSSITREDINLASTIQSRIVKGFTYYEDEHLEYTGSSTMAKGVGGDFYAEAKYKNDQRMFCLCDVSGKGMAASLVTTALWGSFSTFNYELGIKKAGEAPEQGICIDLRTAEICYRCVYPAGSINGKTSSRGHGTRPFLSDQKLLHYQAKRRGTEYARRSCSKTEP